MNGVAIVVGASSGLGKEIAALLRSRGLDVVGVSRRGPDVRGDASKRETAAAAIDEARRRGSLQLLVNCAGVGIYKPAGSYDAHDIELTLTSNLVAMITFCDAVYPLFRDQGGTIVNIMSTAALTGKPGETVYCAAKWGARGYPKRCATKPGARRRVSCPYTPAG